MDGARERWTNGQPTPLAGPASGFAFRGEQPLPTPVLQAIVLADYVHVDAATGKFTICGTFNAIDVAKTPIKLERSTYAYLRLTEIEASKEVLLRYVDLRDRRILMQAEPIRIESRDPLASVEIRVPVPGFPIPHEGVFAFEAICDGEMLGSLRITVRRRKDD